MVKFLVLPLIILIYFGYVVYKEFKKYYLKFCLLMKKYYLCGVIKKIIKYE